EHGYVVTITGRRRQLPEIKSSNGNLRNFGERAAMNMPLQGSAADIMKEAMINVYNRLQREKLISKIIMQVHDELIIDTKQEEVEKVENILREEMENVRSLKCKLSVNLEKGNNLYESK
ncbi:MAG: DNA polymerase, partial [Clostridia bacterium]